MLLREAPAFFAIMFVVDDIYDYDYNIVLYVMRDEINLISAGYFFSVLKACVNYAAAVGIRFDTPHDS